MENEFIAFMFLCGGLMFLFGAMVLRYNNMYTPMIGCFVTAVYYAIHDTFFIKVKEKED